MELTTVSSTQNINEWFYEITNKFHARPWTLHTFKIMLKSHILEYEINLTKRPRHLENTGGFGWHDTTKFAVSKRRNGLAVFVHFSITVTFLNYRNWILHPICENTLLGWEPRLHYRTEWPEWQNEEWVVRVTSVITIENLYYHLN